MKKTDTKTALAAVKVKLEKGTSPPTLFKGKSVSEYNPPRPAKMFKVAEPFTIISNPPPLLGTKGSSQSLTVRLYKSMSIIPDGHAVCISKADIKQYFPDKDYDYIKNSLHARAANYCNQYAPKSKVRVRLQSNGTFLIYRTPKED